LNASHLTYMSLQCPMMHLLLVLYWMAMHTSVLSMLDALTIASRSPFWLHVHAMQQHRLLDLTMQVSTRCATSNEINSSA
ncbi:hypothetical protein CLOM_g14409, partial [Closterium sp. NIES-68]